MSHKIRTSANTVYDISEGDMTFYDVVCYARYLEVEKRKDSNHAIINEAQTGLGQVALVSVCRRTTEK